MWHEAVEKGLREPGFCRIMVIGVGGAGNNTISRLMESGIQGAECVAINTDMQHLSVTHAHQKILIGEKVTRGLGAGGDPKVGREAIEESRPIVENLLTDVDIAFITAGLGGGTGTGAAPVVAEIARENGAIVVGVVTTPFRIEKGRIAYAAQGLTAMRRECDTVIVVDNNKLMELVPQLPINEAFKVGDRVLANMVKGISETISMPSLINLDFADFRTIIKRGGVAIVGVGESDAPNRAEESVKNALRMPLLDVDYSGATGALIHIAGDSQMSIEEANRVGEIVTEMMNNDAMVIWGARVNPRLSGVLRVTLVMTGVKSPYLLSGFGSIAPNLYDLDHHGEPEKPLNIDLGLYQLEPF
ncbi:cell division protein FtsZ [Candidatus Bathyarchaeota archaeon]|nr:MAG: cell division protein FtsZ [Candidatus Bathyarchaeota archaeon ex4484_40]RJS77312.1 MAG: cell division protein FtsZ [Candidatus Bathyarchaeota archaeon]